MEWIAISQISDDDIGRVILVTDGSEVAPSRIQRRGSDQRWFESLADWEPGGYSDVHFAPTHFAYLPAPPS